MTGGTGFLGSHMLEALHAENYSVVAATRGVTSGLPDYFGDRRNREYTLLLLYEAGSSQGFRVALDGQGADELLAWYKHYHIYLILENLRHFKQAQAFSVLTDAIKSGIINRVLSSLRNTLPDWCSRVMRYACGYEQLFNRNFHSNTRRPVHMLEHHSALESTAAT